AYRTVLRLLISSNVNEIGGARREAREHGLWRDLARVYRDRLADDARALEAFHLVIRYDEDDIDDRLELAALHQKRKHYDDPLAILDALLLKDPRRTVIYEQIFEIRALRGETDPAWCAATALVLLQRAREDICDFYGDHAPRLLPARTRALDDDAWAKLRD